MRAISRMCILCLVPVVMMTVGCKETYKLTFTNVSSQPRTLELQAPYEIHPLGMLPPGASRHFTLKFDGDELPANCLLKVDAMGQPFTLDKNMKRELYFYLEDGKIVGPIDQNTKIKSATRFESKGMTAEPNAVIRGDAEPAAPAPSVAPSGGGRVIEQKEVVD